MSWRPNPGPRITSPVARNPDGSRRRPSDPNARTPYPAPLPYPAARHPNVSSGRCGGRRFDLRRGRGFWSRYRMRCLHPDRRWRDRDRLHDDRWVVDFAHDHGAAAKEATAGRHGKTGCQGHQYHGTEFHTRICCLHVHDHFPNRLRSSSRFSLRNSTHFSNCSGVSTSLTLGVTSSRRALSFLAFCRRESELSSRMVFSFSSSS